MGQNAHLKLQPLIVYTRHQRGVARRDGSNDGSCGLLPCTIARRHLSFQHHQHAHEGAIHRKCRLLGGHWRLSQGGAAAYVWLLSAWLWLPSCLAA